MTELDEWMSRKKAAAFLERIGCPLSLRTLNNYAANSNAGRGPSFTRIRGIVRYRRSDLEAWAKREAVRVE